MIHFNLKKKMTIDTRLIFFEKKRFIYMNKLVKIMMYMINIQKSVRIYYLVIPKRIYFTIMIGVYSKVS